MKKKILYVILTAVIAVSLAVSLASCDMLPEELQGIFGGGTDETDAPDLSGIKLQDKTVTYNGEAQSLEVTGTLPEGVTVEYQNNGKTDAGKYAVVAKFYYNGEYIEGADLAAQLRINKASLVSQMEGVSFPSKSFVYDGEAHSLAVVGTLPAGVTVEYDGNAKTEVGRYTVIARFIVDTVNYYPVEDMSATLTITEPAIEIPEIEGITLEGKTVTYNGEEQSLSIEGTLPEGVSVQYQNNGKTDAGKYTVVAKFYYGETYIEGEDLRATLTIEKAVIDLSAISFESKTVLYNGEAHNLAITGELPHGVEVSYVNNGQTYAGEYTVYAFFKVGKNYQAIEGMTATLTIISVDLSDISLEDIAVMYDGTPFSIYLTGIRPEGVTVEYIGNGVSTVGKHTVVAKLYYNGIYLEGQDLTAYIYINQGAESLKELVFEGKTFTYDGTPKSLEVVGEIPKGFTIVGYEGNGEVNAGKYTARVKFAYEGEYNPDWDMEAEYTILPAALPEISATDLTVTFDGKDHAIDYSVAGELPAGVSVSVLGAAHYMPGSYKFSFKYVLEGDAAINYIGGDEVVATLTITGSIDDIVTEGLVYTAVSGGVAVVGYTGESRVVVIPSSALGSKVVAIKSLAFENNKNIKNVIIPDSVTAIGQGAFRGTELREITVPFIGGSNVSSNKFFGYIFGASGYVANQYYVPATLEKVTISDACTLIPAYSFRGCVDLKEVVIGKGVTEIGISAFEKCESLDAIYIPSNVVDIPAAANYYNSPFFDCGEDFKIYLEASSVPATGYGAEWNSVSATADAEVITGKTYAEYLEAKNS